MPRLFVNRLTLMDFSYLDPELGLLGETWLVDLELEGQLNAEGMVLDFGLVKKQIKGFVDQAFDHRLLLPLNYAGCSLEGSAEAMELRFACRNGRHYVHRSPAIALCPLPLAQISPEGVAACMRERLLPSLPANCTALQLRLYTEAIDGPFYQYSHGLRRHDGNCRRIAHGHRSRLQIERNGLADLALAEAWAQSWRRVYLADRRVLLEQFQHQGQGYARFGYDTCEGRYELELPADTCVLLETDTTVEHIAQHIADTLAQRVPGERLRVRAFEGVDKGAVVDV
ncbi:MAG: 6-carboxytetrahydropterin synthase [Gammaproteobacteria bacterium]|nr:6-carboxytetrahydropterin synthase [Gammaproteobacteria bacterium]